MNFLTSTHCTSEAHCKPCRATLTGKKWRDSLIAAFDDLTENMFDCPKGKPWVKTKMKLVGDKVFLDGKECISCGKRSEVKTKTIE